MTITIVKSKKQVETDWYALAQLLPLRPIRSENTHHTAVRILSELASLDHMSTQQSDYFDVLSTLVVQYEEKKWAIDTADISAIDILKSLIDDHNMTASDLGRLLGDRTLGHKILTKKRNLTTAQTRTLADYFKVSTDLFI